MDSYFALLIPIVLSILAFLIFKEKLTWYEVLIPIFVGFILIISLDSIMKSSNTSDIEYLSTYANSVSYEEPWNEYIEQTCSRQYQCGTNVSTDANGNTTSTPVYCTEYYDCSYVKEHGPEWYVNCIDGKQFNISETKYNELKKEWNNNIFIDMHRDYHTKDGDKYMSNWNKNIDNIFTCNWTQTYENKVQASHSIYNFKELSEEDIISNRLFTYPDITYYSYNLNSILSQKAIAPQEHKTINIINGFLGSKKKFHLWILVFDENNTQSIADLQQSYWKGGNKNELVVCIGVDKIRRIKWNHIFTWSDKQLVRIKVRNYLNSKKGEFLNFYDFSKFLIPLINNEWEMKNWHDFDFLIVELNDNQLILLYILVFISTIICLIIGINNNNHSDNFVKYTGLNNVVKNKYKTIMEWIRYRMGTDEIKY